jgi:hypothetical protein
VADFLILTHADAHGPVSQAAWEPFIARLIQGGHLKGGSSLGPSVTLHHCAAPPSVSQLAGYLLIEATSLDEARALCKAIPDYLNGATVQILPLVEDD